MTSITGNVAICWTVAPWRTLPAPSVDRIIGKRRAPISDFVGQTRTLFAAGTAVRSDVCPYLCGLRMAADDLQLDGRNLVGIDGRNLLIGFPGERAFSAEQAIVTEALEKSKKKNIMKPIDAVQNGIECKQSADCFLPTKKAVCVDESLDFIHQLRDHVL
jgi:hypothetical protein